MLESPYCENETTEKQSNNSTLQYGFIAWQNWLDCHACRSRQVIRSIHLKIISKYPRIIFSLGCFTTQKDTCKAGFLFYYQPSLTHAGRLMSSFRLSSILAPCGRKAARNMMAVMWYEKQKADFYLIKRAISLIPFVNDSITTNTNLPFKKTILILDPDKDPTTNVLMIKWPEQNSMISVILFLRFALKKVPEILRSELYEYNRKTNLFVISIKFKKLWQSIRDTNHYHTRSMWQLQGNNT